MTPEARRKHLHASVGAGVLFGLAIGGWLGFRGPHAGWLEGCAFAAFVMFGPALVFPRIDARFCYTVE